MIKKIAYATVAILIIVVAFATMQPDRFEVQRTVTIKAPPEKIVGMIGDFRQWPSWSPWEQLDPGMTRTFSGPASGKGAVYHWKGNSDVGEGRMEITDMAAPSRVVIKLDFTEPMESRNVTQFTLEPQGEMTKVNWEMAGPMSFVTKLVSIFMSMDKMVGRDFEKGLAKMKAVAES